MTRTEERYGIHSCTEVILSQPIFGEHERAPPSSVAGWNVSLYVCNIHCRRTSYRKYTRLQSICIVSERERHRN